MLKPLCTLVAATAILIALTPAVARAEPQMRVGTGFAITPAQALTYYSNQGLASPAWTEDPELKKLATALGNDPDRIYEYVRNEIEVIPLFGVHAGARGALIDKAGTPFDQAQLMVELLRSAGTTASYQYGTITLTGTQFSDWLGLTNPTAAKKLLADGGMPYTMVDNGTTITSVTLAHLWVRATIGGQTYSFDPAYKPYSVAAGINLDTAMGLNTGTFWSGQTNSALTGATTATTNSTPRVSTLNRTGVRANLNTYATSLLNYINANVPNGSMDNVIGGRTIVAYAGAALRQTALPYQASTDALLTGDIPVAMRTKVTLLHNSTTSNFYLDDIYGKQLTLETNPDNPLPPGQVQYRLLVGEQDITGWINGFVHGAQVTINHPYAAGTASGVVDGTYMDHQVSLAAPNSPGMQIFVSSGRPSADFGAYQERVHSGRSGVVVYHNACCIEPPGDQWAEPQEIALRRRMGAMFLSQFTDMTQLVGGAGNAVVVIHDIVGAATTTNSYGSDRTAPVASSFTFSMEPSISAIVKTGVATQTPAVTRTVAMMSSALEGSVAQQASNSVYPISAVAQLDWANTGPAAADRWYYYATSANWNAWARSQILLNYDFHSPGVRSPIRDVADAYIAAGWTIMIPRSSALGPGPAKRLYCIPWDEQVLGGGITHHDCAVIGPELAGALIAINPTTGAIAHISARDSMFGKGGGGGADVETNPAKVFAIAENFLDKQYSSRAEAGKVDLKSGALTYTPPPDITVGNGGYPYSLSFQRSYRYQYNTDIDHWQMQNPVVQNAPVQTIARDDSFGTSGWTSNFTHYASITTDGAKIFGRDDPRVAAQTLVTAKVLLSFMGDGTTTLETLERQIVGAFTAYWWTETIQENTITVHQGHDSRSFTKLHGGSFVARGSAETAELLGTRTIVAPSSPSQFCGDTHHWSYQHTVRITGAQREISVYAGGSTDTSICGGNDDGNMMFQSQTFPFGVTVTYDPVTRTLSNNLGRSITVSSSGTSVTTNAGGTVTFDQVDLGQGPKLTVTDLMGNQWQYVEDAARTSFEVRPPTTPTAYFTRYEYVAGTFGVVDKVKDANANATIYTIGSDRAAAVTDALGFTSRTRHNAFGNVVKVEDALGRIVTTDYDNYRRKSKETAPEGNFTTWTYDANSNVLSTTETPKPGSPPSLLPKTTSATYDPLCNVALTNTDEMGRVTNTVINQTTCKVTSITGPPVNPPTDTSRPITTFTYNSLGQVLTKTDPTGLVTQMTYDAVNGNVLSVIQDPGVAPHIAATTVFAYDTIGNITSLTDPRGFIHTATYDAMRRITSYTAPTGTNAKTKWTYDVDGLITKIEQASNAAQTTWATTDYTYWPTGRVRTVTDADGRVTRFSYDATDELSTTTDPENRVNKRILDAAGQLIEDRRAVGTPQEQAYQTISYTPNGKQAWVKDAKLNQTTYTYDGFDRLSVTTFPDATHEDLTYDPADNVLTKRARNAQLIQNSYDQLDRVVTHTVPQPNAAPAIVTSYTYDLAGRVVGVSDNTGQILTYAFDSAKRPISVTQTAPNFAGARVVNYQLDAVSNKTRTTWADGYYVQYAYDALNRTTTATENGTFVLATYIYDTLGRRTSLVYGNGANQGYTYSTRGDMLTLANTLTGVSNVFTNTFTKAHQLASEATTNAAWSYLPSVFQATNYAPANNLNQYVNITVGANPTQTMGYDANGNLTGDGTWTFAYDAQNFLRSATKSGTSAGYVYDPIGRRQAKSVNGVTTSFLHDRDEEIAEYNGTTLLRRYVPGPGTDMPIAMVTPAGGSSNTHNYFHTNRQGSTVAMSADNGTMSEGTYTYDSYGNGGPVTGVPFKYTGRRLDPETGLYYYRARYYSPAIGRFLQTDGVGYEANMNLYDYADNDPTDKTDPSGNSPLEIAFLVADVVDLASKVSAGEDITEAAIMVAVDVVGVASPIPGVSEAAHAAEAGIKVARVAERGVEAVRAAEHGVDGAKAESHFAEAAAKTCCFAAGTLVETDHGLKAIETINVGDRVLSRNEATAETAYKPVTQLIRRHDREIWDLKLSAQGDDGKVMTTVFHTTDDHPWRSAAGMWIKTMDLKPGMEILRARGPPAKVVSVDPTGKTQRTFNLEVGEFHTYFAGAFGIWVHNACSIHANSASSRRLNHRYEISEVKSGDVVKTGVSSTKVTAKTSQRATLQVNKLNKAEGAGKYTSRVKQQRIAGRAKALEMEQKATNRLAKTNSLRLQQRPKPQ